MTAALDTVLQRHFAQAALRLHLDEELGTHHGLAWDDFVLLAALDAAGGVVSTQALARRLGMSASGLVLRLLPLQKTGLVERAAAQPGVREVRLRPAGRRLLGEARETAQVVCAADAAATNQPGHGRMPA